MNQENHQKAKRYYWLKLQDNFFERDEIKIIEAMPNGKDYILFYLKIMLKSINENGRLVFKKTIPYCQARNKKGPLPDPKRDHFKFNFFTLN